MRQLESRVRVCAQLLQWLQRFAGVQRDVRANTESTRPSQHAVGQPEWIESADGSRVAADAAATTAAAGYAYRSVSTVAWWIQLLLSWTAGFAWRTYSANVAYGIQAEESGPAASAVHLPWADEQCVQL